MDTAFAIEINKLSKQYVAHAPYAVKDLTIHIKKGEIYGFLGPNGSGKSTTIRTLLNFIQPTSGTAKILGKDIVSETVNIRKSLGYLSGDFKAYEKMTGRQFLEFMSAIQPLKRKSSITDLARTFQAPLHKRVRDLSKGNRQKIGIIQAFMHEPEVLILDEPTDGLDPLMQEAFYDLVRSRQSNGATVFVSSHNLAEVQKMCDRVAIIREGKLVSESAIADLAIEAAQTFEVVFANNVTKKQLLQIPGVKKVSNDTDKISIHVHGDLGPFLRFLSQQKITQLATKELNLEEEFLRFYEEGVKK